MTMQGNRESQNSPVVVLEHLVTSRDETSCPEGEVNEIRIPRQRESAEALSV